MPLTRASSLVIDIVDVSTSLKSNNVDNGIRDYVDDQILLLNNSLSSLISSTINPLSSTVDNINSSFFNKSVGGIVTGPVISYGSTGGVSVTKSNPTINLSNTDSKGIANTNNVVRGTKEGGAVWDLILGDSTAMSGLNEGAGFKLMAYADSGIALEPVLEIPRRVTTPLKILRNVSILHNPGESDKSILNLDTKYHTLSTSSIFGRRQQDGGNDYLPMWSINMNPATFSVKRYDSFGVLIDTSLQINRSDGAVSLKGYNGYSVASSGWVILPGNLIMQWGTTSSISNNATLAVTFPKVFPTGCLNVTATRVTNGNNSATANAYSTTGFNLYNRPHYSDSSATANVYTWVAIGY
jgi:hypothetical protein